MYNVSICVSKIPVIVLKSKKKRLTCYIVSATGSLGSNPTAAAVPAGFLCSYRQSIMLPLQRKRRCQLTFLCINVFGERLCEWVKRATGFFLFCDLFSAEGEVYTWGKGARGRLGRKEEDCGIPKALQLDESHPYVVTSVACFNGNSLLAVKRNIFSITLLLPI